APRGRGRPYWKNLKPRGWRLARRGSLGGRRRAVEEAGFDGNLARVRHRDIVGLAPWTVLLPEVQRRTLQADGGDVLIYADGRGGGQAEQCDRLGRGLESIIQWRARGDQSQPRRDRVTRCPKRRAQWLGNEPLAQQPIVALDGRQLVQNVHHG